MKLQIAWKRASGLKAEGYIRMVWGELPVEGLERERKKKSLSYVLLFSYEILSNLIDCFLPCYFSAVEK